MLYGAIVFFVFVLPVFPPFGFWRSYVHCPLDWRPLLMSLFTLSGWFTCRIAGSQGKLLKASELHRIPLPKRAPKTEALGNS